MDLTYHIVRSRLRRRTIALKVLADGTVEIRAPLAATDDHIEDLLRERRSWIEDRVRVLRRGRDPDSLPYLGVPHPLVVAEGPWNTFSLQEGRFVIPDGMKDRLEPLAAAWYGRRAAEYLPGRVSFYGGASGLKPKGLRITDARRRWGSCSPRNCLAFPWRLMMVPPEVIDYIVVHELAHIAVKDHSRRFWDTVSRILPDYRRRRQWLRRHGPFLPFP
ncbi:MAG TPA: SprT family zinc-dependent metalloprotease [Syntrophales bacterium]|nr:SprT family zinc-dependent metalloprotease [Syntrophales bacterium]HOM06584.1 SprT family zinc-dependent metalloprotease [Syntrophales bacterium]HON99633.1 SprT family zinc-dependent metalloprotease [Syntrophales bacterium]HPQ06154.1 SprT family zinc-dependent metalloprotease [Syntrophales bacterium]HRS86386.1 SprT family zinc-dependent metalloprotease [Syntrophales bacterium]